MNNTVLGPYTPIQWQQLKDIQQAIKWSKDHPEAPTGRFDQGIELENKHFKRLINR